MQYKILPSVKLQDKLTTNWTNNFSKGLILIKHTLFCYYSKHTGNNMESGGWDSYTTPTITSTSRNCVSLNIRDIPCAMMTINLIDYATWLVCNLQTRERFLNMSLKMKITSSINFFCQEDIISKVWRSYLFFLTLESKLQSNHNSKWVIWAWAEARSVCGFDLKTFLWKLCSLGRFRSYKKITFMGKTYTLHPACPKG